MHDAIHATEETGQLAKTTTSELASLGLTGKLIIRTTTNEVGDTKSSRMIEVSRGNAFVARVFVRDLAGFLIGYAAGADTR